MGMPSPTFPVDNSKGLPILETTFDAALPPPGEILFQVSPNNILDKTLTEEDNQNHFGASHTSEKEQYDTKTPLSNCPSSNDSLTAPIDLTKIKPLKKSDREGNYNNLNNSISTNKLGLNLKNALSSLQNSTSSSAKSSPAKNLLLSIGTNSLNTPGSTPNKDNYKKSLSYNPSDYYDNEFNSDELENSTTPFGNSSVEDELDGNYGNHKQNNNIFGTINNSTIQTITDVSEYQNSLKL